MTTDMAPTTDQAAARPAARDAGALLRHADELARAAVAVPALARQKLAPLSQLALREDDLSLTGGFVHAIARQLGEALYPPGLALDPAMIAQDIILTDSAAISVLFARAIEARLCANASLAGLAMPELPPRVEQPVGDAQDELAQAAMALIIAQSRFIGNAQGFTLDLAELPPELVSTLVRRTLGWLQDQLDADPLALRACADALLYSFDERRGRPHRLMRFCHLFEFPRAGDDWSLAENGPSLIFAMLARASGLPTETLIDMVRDADLARLAVVLRGCGLMPDPASQLLAGIALIASLRLEDVAAAPALASINPDDAARLVASWRNLLPLSAPGLVL